MCPLQVDHFKMLAELRVCVLTEGRKRWHSKVSFGRPKAVVHRGKVPDMERKRYVEDDDPVFETGKLFY
jgi:hypothetical protein